MLEDFAARLLAEYDRTFIPLEEIGLRLILAAALAGILGFEREVKRRSAGLRTHMMVSLAAATFTIGALELLHWTDALEESPARVDPSRALEAITAGVAFLAAGTIISSRRGTRGLTTGAGMWLAGSIGLVSGIGLYAFALTATLVGLVILLVLGWLEKLTTKKLEEEGIDTSGGGEAERAADEGEARRDSGGGGGLP
jgi:putative Mg2+ transporter-C (MgtC) family protein